MGLIMGLLDFGNPQTAGLMGIAQGLLSSSGATRMPTTLGAALGQSVGMGQDAYQHAARLKVLQDQQELERRMKEMALAKMEQEKRDAEALRNFDFGRYYQTPQQQAIGLGGPTNEAAALIPTLAPKLDQSGMIAGMMASKNPALVQSAMGMLTKEDTPIVLAKGGKAVTRTGREIASNPDAPELKGDYVIFNPITKKWEADPELFKAAEQLKATGAPKTVLSPTIRVGNTFSEGIAKQGAERLFKQIEAASDAPKLADAGNQILTALNSGKVMAGPGTSWAMAAKQIYGADPEKLKETRAAIQGMAKLLIASRQSLKNQGTITDFETKMLQRAESGDIDSMSVDEIRLIASGAVKNASTIYEQGVKSKAALSAMPEFKSILPAFDLPPMSAPGSSGGPPPGAVRRIE